MLNRLQIALFGWALMIAGPCLTAEAQTKKEASPKSKPAAKKKSPAEIREDLERLLPTGDGKDRFIVVTIEKTMEQVTGKNAELAEGPLAFRTVRKAHRIDGRPETVDFLVKHLTRQSGDLKTRKGGESDALMLGDILSLTQRSWEFVAAFPNSDAGKKDAAASLEAARQRIASEDRANAKKKADRKKRLKRSDR